MKEFTVAFTGVVWVSCSTRTDSWWKAARISHVVLQAELYFFPSLPLSMHVGYCEVTRCIAPVDFVQLRLQNHHHSDLLLHV